MLFFNPKRVFALRGVDNPMALMLKNGISRPTVRRILLGEKAGVSYGHLEILCRLLNCTPNDFFEYHPDGDANLPENHALNSLRRSKSSETLRDLLSDVPVNEIENLLSELKKD